LDAAARVPLRPWNVPADCDNAENENRRLASALGYAPDGALESCLQPATLSRVILVENETHLSRLNDGIPQVSGL